MKIFAKRSEYIATRQMSAAVLWNLATHEWTIMPPVGRQCSEYIDNAWLCFPNNNSYAAWINFMRRTNISSFHVPHQYQFHNTLPIFMRRTPISLHFARHTNFNFTTIQQCSCGAPIWVEHCEMKWILVRRTYKIEHCEIDISAEHEMRETFRRHTNMSGALWNWYWCAVWIC